MTNHAVRLKTANRMLRVVLIAYIIVVICIVALPATYNAWNLLLGDLFYIVIVIDC